MFCGLFSSLFDAFFYKGCEFEKICKLVLHSKIAISPGVINDLSLHSRCVLQLCIHFNKVVHIL